MAPASPAGDQQVDAEAGDGQARDRAQPGVESLGHDVPGRVQRHAPEQVHARGVGRRHDQAKRRGVASGAPRADEIGGHHGLAVPRLQRMKAPESRGGHEGGQHHAEAQLPPEHEAGEGALRDPLDIGLESDGFRRDGRRRRGRRRLRGEAGAGDAMLASSPGRGLGAGAPGDRAATAGSGRRTAGAEVAGAGADATLKASLASSSCGGDSSRSVG